MISFYASGQEIIMKKVFTQFFTKTNRSPENSNSEKVPGVYSQGKTSLIDKYKDEVKHYKDIIGRSDKTGSFYLKDHYRCGLALLNLDELSEALDHFNVVLANEQLFTCEQGFLSEVYESYGFVLLLMGKSHFEQALENFNKSLQHNSHNASSLFYRGILYFLIEDSEQKAQKAINKSLGVYIPGVLIGAATFCEKVNNKNLGLYEDAEKIMSFLKKIPCIAQQIQTPSLANNPSKSEEYSYDSFSSGSTKQDKGKGKLIDVETQRANTTGYGTFGLTKTK